MNEITSPNGLKISNQELEEMVKGVAIIDTHSGLPLFSRLSQKIDSSIFSGLLTAINSLSEELTLGSLSSFTTQYHKVFVTAGVQLVVALFSDNIDQSLAYQLTNKICKAFEEKYTIPSIPNTDDYLNFNTDLDIILKECFQTKNNDLLYVHDGLDHFILTKVVSTRDLIDRSVLIHCSIPDKKVYIMYNSENIPSRLKYLAQKEAKRINSELLNNQFTIRDIYDRVELDYIFSRIKD